MTDFETPDGAQARVDAEAALRSAADVSEADARAAHEALTTGAHGGIVATTDPRLSDQRVPVDASVTLAKLAFDVATQAELDAEATARTSAIGVETAARIAADGAESTARLAHAALTIGAHGGIVASTDARLSDARTPTAHAASHLGGVDDLLASLDPRYVRASGVMAAIGASGMRVLPPFITSTGTSGLTAGTERVVPFLVTKTTTYDLIGVNIVSAGAAGTTIRLGIRFALANGLPGAVAIDAGAVNGTSVSFQEISMSVTLAPGVYWLCVLPLVGNPAVTSSASGAAIPSVSSNPISVNIPRAYNGAASLSAFPANFTPTGDAAGAPLVTLRIA